jgi:CopG family nickel-responsive transcriptional regulator
MNKITRFGVSLPENIVQKFDAHIEELGYSNRSKAIQDAITDFMTQNIWKQNEGRFIGTISYLYDHHVPDVNKRLVDLQHGFDRAIKSTMHSHITHDECVEVLIVEGNAKDIQRLYGQLSAIRGVQNCKMAALLDK